MLELIRIKENPIIFPNEENEWETDAAFNPCVIKHRNKYHMLYRAMSLPKQHQGVNMPVSSIGYAVSNDGVCFTGRRLLIMPEQDWEIYGCEDPRVTKVGKYYYIFYTALSTYPFSAEGIKIGLVITKDFQHIEEKHPVTPFNSKAMALFPEKINGKLAAVLTVHTDTPPAKIALAFFDKASDIWSPQYWKNWYADLNTHVISLLRSPADHVEVGAPPVKTKAGWILIYAYIKNYFSPRKVFGIEAVLLNSKYPTRVIGRTDNLLIPEKDYELYGNVANIAFPSGALVRGGNLWVYYGAADTSGCLAKISLKTILHSLTQKSPIVFAQSKTVEEGFRRFDQNPIITPRLEFDWELMGTLNPAAIRLYNGIHIIYRAFSNDNTSTLGYAFTKDGVHIEERLAEPIYIPREHFEIKQRPGFSGCEDPRITKIGGYLYMLYTAFNGEIPRVAMTSIKVDDFLKKKWNWTKPKLISPPNVADKNSCLFPRKVNGEYVFLHRVGRSIYIDFISESQFKNGQEFLTAHYLLMSPRPDKWDNRKIGCSAPPIETKQGWLLLYHGVSDPGSIYKVGAALLSLRDPREVLARTDIPVFKPEMEYEKSGFVHNVIFPCGTVIIKDKIYLYYGGGDSVIGVAVIELKNLLKLLMEVH
jgi:predicted GH43/DUF377 family glycosyl hydrolase